MHIYAYLLIVALCICTVAGVSLDNSTENYVDNGATYVFGHLNSSFEYTLRAYLDETESESWPLGPYVLLAKTFILSVLQLDLGMHT